MRVFGTSRPTNSSTGEVTGGITRVDIEPPKDKAFKTINHHGEEVEAPFGHAVGGAFIRADLSETELRNGCKGLEKILKPIAETRWRLNDHVTVILVDEVDETIAMIQGPDAELWEGPWSAQA